MQCSYLWRTSNPQLCNVKNQCSRICTQILRNKRRISSIFLFLPICPCCVFPPLWGIRTQCIYRKLWKCIDICQGFPLSRKQLSFSNKTFIFLGTVLVIVTKHTGTYVKRADQEVEMGCNTSRCAFNAQFLTRSLQYLRVQQLSRHQQPHDSLNTLLIPNTIHIK